MLLTSHIFRGEKTSNVQTSHAMSYKVNWPSQACRHELVGHNASHSILVRVGLQLE